MESFPENLQIKHKNILIAIPSYASVSQLATSVILSSVEAAFSNYKNSNVTQSNDTTDANTGIQFMKVGSLVSPYVTPVVVSNDDETTLETAMDIYQMNEDWVILMIRGLISHRRRFAKDLVEWIQNQKNITNVFTVAGGNAVFRNSGFHISDPADPNLRRILHIPTEQGDMPVEDREDFLCGELYYFVEAFEKAYEVAKANKDSCPSYELLLLLCNEGDNRNDALFCASYALHEWIKKDIPCSVPKAWECLYGTMSSKFLFV